MKELVKAKTGFLYYEEVCVQFGKTSMDSLKLIAKNLIHLRPTKRFSYDLLYQKAIITAETPCGLIAMKRVLMELERIKDLKRKKS